MNLKQILPPVLGAALVVLAHRAYGWPGVAVAVGGIVMWALLHVNRILQVFRRAANRPVGYVDSAVMLNAKLQVGQNLLHVLALTRALGQLQSPPDTQPEVFRWTDAGGSHVTCTLRDGRVQAWTLWRPPADEAPAQDPAPAAGAPPGAP